MTHDKIYLTQAFGPPTPDDARAQLMGYFDALMDECKTIPLEIQFMNLLTRIETFCDRQKEKSSCSRGRSCCYCCFIPVDVSLYESKRIHQYLRKNGLTKRLWHMERSDPSACPFLGFDGLCTIYPVRPLSCQKYLSFGAPARCDTKKYPGGSTSIAVNHENEVYYSVFMSLSGHIKIDDVYGGLK